MPFISWSLLLVALYAVVILPAGAQAPALERYIVVLNARGEPAQVVASEVAQRTNGQIGYVYNNALQGFSIMLPPRALAAIQNDPRVAYVETDDPVQLFAQTLPTGVDRIFDPGANDPPTTAGSAIDSALSIDGQDDWRVDVDVAVIDTGIDYEHPDLNVVGGTSCLYTTGGGPPWARRYSCGTGGDDDHYHGTHVAGTIGALDNGFGVVGVAPGARLWAVKVLDSSGSGYESGIVAGIDWVAANAATIEVANMSLGGTGYSQAEYDAIQGAVYAGVVFVVAAGNSNADASLYSPAAFNNAVTVSALADFNGVSGDGGSPTCRDDQDDTLADFSNWGSAVDIAAPGVCITSTFPLEKGEYGIISGTSMASPHVAGAAALLASSLAPSDSTGVAALVNTLILAGNDQWTDDSGDGIKEPLLDISSFNPRLVANGGGGNTNMLPTAVFTYTCSGLSCTFEGSGSSDSDGTIVGYNWDFGDNAMAANDMSITHTYVADGTYTVTLTVTDNDGAVDTAQQDVSVAASGGARELLASSINNGSSWTANVRTSDNSALIGSWSYTAGAASCSDSTCSVSGIPKKQSSVVFTSDKNETITIFKP